MEVLLASAAQDMSSASVVLSAFFGALSPPDAKWIELANLFVGLYVLATSGDHHRATTARLGEVRAGRALRAGQMARAVAAGEGKRGRKRVRRPVGVGRAK